MMRRHTPDEIRERAMQAALKKYDEGCADCSAAYLRLARENGATEDEIQRAGMSRRGFMRFAGLALAAGATAISARSLIGIKSANAMPMPNNLQTGVNGYFGVDSCTAPDTATAQSMPLQFYIAELGGTNNSVGCFNPDTAAMVGDQYTHGYWGLCGPNLATSTTPFAYGQQQAQAAVTAWHNTQGIGGLTLFADVESGFGGWGDGATQKDMAAVLDGFLTGVANEQFVPGVYINAASRDAWFPDSYVPAVPFVYWVAGGQYAGMMCPPCAPDCDTLTPVYNAWNAAMQQETFAGQGAVIWQYWLSQFGCGGDFNYSPQTGYQKFVPVPPSTVPVSVPTFSAPTTPTATPATPSATPGQ